MNPGPTGELRKRMEALGAITPRLGAARPSEEIVPLQRLDGRASGTETVEEKKWWVVEWRQPQHRLEIMQGWTPFDMRFATIDGARSAQTKLRRAANEEWRVVEVVVVERRRVVEEVPAGSPIDQAHPLPGDKAP